ncbi:MAG: hypothetical protein AB7P94_17465 [Steroidobacteraceae bacterium]|jgi:hypothetical protein
MSNSITWKIHAVVSTILATTIVTFAALTLDQGHIAAAPRGIVEIGTLVPVETAPTVENA